MRNLYGFIGCGNMGSALIRAVAKKTEGRHICIFDTQTEKADVLVDELGLTKTQLEPLCENADMLVLGVKPQSLGELMSTIAPVIKKRKNQPLVISMLAGTSIKTLENYLPNTPILRIMPNLPAMVGKGMILYDGNAKVEESDYDKFVDDFQFAGRLLHLKEEKIDAGCALSGSGPAYVFMMAEALADGGVACGLTREEAMTLAAQTLLGSAEMLLDGTNPSELKNRVCSPAGTTIEGVMALEDGNFRHTVMKAVDAGYNRSLELRELK